MRGEVGGRVGFGRTGQGEGPYRGEGVGVAVGVGRGVLDELGLGAGAEGGRDRRAGDRRGRLRTVGRTYEMEAEVDAGRGAR